MIHALALLVFVLYVVFLAFCIRATIKQHPRLGFKLEVFEYLTFCIQCILLFILWTFEGYHADWADLFFNVSLLLIAGDIVLRRRYSYPILSVVIVSAGIVFFLSSSLLMHLGGELKFESSTLTYVLHVIPASITLLSQILLFACCGAVLFFDFALRKKKASLLFLPNPGLSKLQQWVKNLVFACFMLWTITLISGAVYALSRGANFLVFDFINVFTVFSWLAAVALMWKTFSDSHRMIFIARAGLFISIVIISVYLTRSFLMAGTVHTWEIAI